MEDKTYNGWTNYETWRIALEWFDNNDDDTIKHLVKTSKDTYELSRAFKDYVHDLFDEHSGDNPFMTYALAFLEEVNWYEIAEHFTPEEIEEEEA